MPHSRKRFRESKAHQKQLETSLILAQQAAVSKAQYLQLSKALEVPNLTVEQRVGITIRMQAVHQ